MVTLRAASAQDEPFLRAMLANAADWRPAVEVRPVAEVMRDRGIAHYVAGWPMKGDFGVVAEVDDTPIGAAWCRFFDQEPRGYGFVAPDVPELTIGVVGARRGGGVGRRLLQEIIIEAQQRGIKRISLSVEADNPAMNLYSDLGFVEVARVADSPTMVLGCN
jgi:ribosomal protein S18 acetylase RimI-like enzyme